MALLAGPPGSVAYERKPSKTTAESGKEGRTERKGARRTRIYERKFKKVMTYIVNVGTCFNSDADILS